MDSQEPEFSPIGEKVEEEQARQPAHLTPRTLKLFSLKDIALSEEDTRHIFDMYAVSEPNFLLLHELRVFLMDLQEAFNFPPFVPDESLSLALKELQLDSERPDRLGWPDFKSFFVYLSQNPLKQLQEIVSSPVLEANCSFQSAVIVSEVPSSASHAEFEDAFRSQVSNFVKSFVSTSKDGSTLIAIVFFSREEEAFAAISLSGCTMLGKQVIIQKYENQKFPPSATLDKPSAVARFLADAALFGVKLTGKIDSSLKISETAKKIDNSAKITENSKLAGKKVSEGASQIHKKTSDALKQVDDRFQISTAMSDAGNKISEGAKSVDEKLHITKTLSDVKTSISQNPNVQRGASVISGWFSSVSASINQLATETKELYEEKRNSSQDKISSPNLPVSEPILGDDPLGDDDDDN